MGWTVLLTGCAGQTAPPITADGRLVLVAGDVLDVQDGDTFRFNTPQGEVTIRLLGVNAPERDECLHDEAAAGLTRLLENPDVGFDGHGQDQFGRTLGYVWAGDTLVNLELVEKGLAVATTPEQTETWGAELVAAEESAYRSAIGLWDSGACGDNVASVVDLAIDTSGHNPPGPDDEALDLEHVTVINNGPYDTDISGWVLRDESSSHRLRFSNGTVIESGATLEVSSGNPAWDPGGSPVWNNEGDIALMLTPEGTVAARERYRS